MSNPLTKKKKKKDNRLTDVIVPTSHVNGRHDTRTLLANLVPPAPTPHTQSPTHTAHSDTFTVTFDY